MAKLAAGSSVAVGVVGASVGLGFSVLFRGILTKSGRSDLGAPSRWRSWRSVTTADSTMLSGIVGYRWRFSRSSAERI